jgi:uncharacterized protein
MRTIISIFLSCFVFQVFSQETKFKTEEIDVNTLIKGTLFTPEKSTKKTKLVILIAGSGPTNRSGNQVGMSNNSLKYLAEGLAKEGIAVFSYDKRIFTMMKAGKIDEKTLRFEDMITDANDVFNYFKSQKKYKKILFAGHSEGSLVGMISAKKVNANGFISLAGIGRPIEVVITEQIGKQLPALKKETEENLKLLKEGKTFENKTPMLASLFRESVQPYMISWLQFNAITEIKKLEIPVLIINGTKDLQVSVTDANLLKEAYPNGQLEIIENMNHVLKEIKIDEDNLKSYSNPDLPVVPILIEKMTAFIKSI